MVFTETARQMVVEQGLATADQVRVVPHGAPDVLNAVAAAWTDRRSLPAAGLTEAANELGLDRLASRTVLSTFGLISASKGLELMIRALPPVVAARPDVLYLIAGQTHPEVVKHEGESYRLGLEQLVHDLGLDEHVAFVDRFLSVDELAVLLARTDLYVTPYRSPEQIVSGALTFAVAAGCRLSPRRYAENLLGSGAGVLVPFGDVPRLSAAVLDLLETPASWTRPGSRLGGSRRTCPGPAWARSPWRSWPRPSTTSGPRPGSPAGRDQPAGDPDRPPAAAGRRRRHHPARLRHGAGPLDRLLRRRRGTAGHRGLSAGAGSDSPATAHPGVLLGLPDPRWGPGRSACATSWTTDGAGWTSRTSATMWAGRSGPWARWSRPTHRGRSPGPVCAC